MLCRMFEKEILGEKVRGGGGRRGEGGGEESIFFFFCRMTAKGKMIEKLRFGRAIGRSCFG